MFSKLIRIQTKPLSFFGARLFSTSAESPLFQRVADKVPQLRKEFVDLKKKYGERVMGPVTVNAALGGMRGLNAMFYETSILDEHDGIRFRGHSIPEIRQLLPKAQGGEEPLPEGLLWLLMTGEVPNESQVASVTADLHRRARALPPHVKTILSAFPPNMHPMAQLISAVGALQTESKFNQLYAEGKIGKQNYWVSTLDDALNLIACLPEVSATIYNNCFKNRVATVNQHKGDWASNFSNMMGYDSFEFHELMRLYLSIHADHEGGNVSAHSTHLVGSALTDPYLSYAAGMCGLAGPLHGLANQEVLKWIIHFRQQFGGAHPSKDQLKKACWDTLNKGNVIPGYGHAVLRNTDPRYMSLREFSLKHFPNDPMFKLVSDLFEVVPQVLTEHGKTKNPWPNVDAHSGVCLRHFGLVEQDFYTVLFGVSRGLGVLSALVIDRILGLPIERPKSIDSTWLKTHLEGNKPIPTDA